MNRNSIFTSLAVGLSLLGSAVPATARTVTDSVTIHFRQSKTDLDTALMNNRASLEGILNRIKRYTEEPDYSVRRITVWGAASPEGTVKFNQWLSEKRAEQIFNFLSERYELPDSLAHFTYKGRDWKGLEEMVRADRNIPYYDETLTLVCEIADDVEANGATASNKGLRRLKALRKGVPYRYLYKNIFPELRESRLSVEYEFPEIIPEVIEVKPAETLEVVETVEELPEPEPVKTCSPFYMDVRTNMLYDVAAVPNLGAEFYLGKNLSVIGNWMYAWWKQNRHHRFWRVYGGDLGMRWWFGGSKPLQGHHLGVYGQVLTYDFEWGGKGYMGGKPGGTLWDRANWGAGLEYGYSLAIARHLNIDFSIGAGYFGGKYTTYVPKDGMYVWQANKKRNWWGPTKAEISLVWLIGCDNVNPTKTKKVKKGGEQ